MELTTDANDTFFVSLTIYFVRPKMFFSLFLPTNVVLSWKLIGDQHSSLFHVVEILKWYGLLVPKLQNLFVSLVISSITLS
jgi:hypothetical protein